MQVDRRTMVGMLAATPLAGAAARTPPAAAIDWAPLKAKLGARLAQVESPLAACARAGGAGAEALFAGLRNPYLLGDEPGLTQTLGWVDAWTSAPSAYAVAATSAADVTAAVDFARATGVRLAVKGGGHSYFGNSNAADSLLIWTRPMQEVVLHDAFRPAGAPASVAPVTAARIDAGALWGRVYDAVAVKGGRYIQGGGCLTVGVAGFTCGGGFGWFSKAFGTGASNLLEAEVVTADGRTRIANAYQDPELFFGLRGGGGGTFGVVTRLTVATHPLPATVSAVQFQVGANSDAAWRALVARTVGFYAEALFGPVWGEQLRFLPRRRLAVSMLAHGLSEAQTRAAWAPFLAWLRARPADYALAGDPLFLTVPFGKIWDAGFLRSVPGVVTADPRPGARADNVFWTNNVEEAGQVLNAYQSAWLPAALLAPARQAALVDALVAASAVWTVSLHTNKGLAGGSADALARTRATATNPAVLDAFALLICAAEQPPAWPGIPGHQPDLALGRQEAAQVGKAMAPIRRLVPGGDCYVSEADYHDRDWQRAYWGSHYPRLLAAKRRYDPAGMFRGHHIVGSG